MFDCRCNFCGTIFQAKQPSAICCNECKSRPCLICGKPFKRSHPFDQKCCSKECRKILLNNPERQKGINAKRDATVKMKYGVSNVNELKDVRNKISRSKTDKEAYFEEKAADIEANKKPVLRLCRLCGEEFVASEGGSWICSKDHYRECAVCGKQFVFNKASNVRNTCSQTCQLKLIQQNMKEEEKVCAYCGKKFKTIWRLAQYCGGPHYKKCEICGKEFAVVVINSVDNLPRTCSNECRQILIEKTNLERYGVKYYVQTPEAREFLHNKSKEKEEQRKETNLEKFGYPYPTQNPVIRKKLSQAASSPEVIAKTRATTQEKYGVNYVMQSAEFARKHSNSQFHQVTCDGTRVDSRWEALIYNFLKRNNINFEYNTYSIEFEYNGSKHVTHIDFKIGDLLLEVKGSHLLEGAFSDAPGVVPIDVKIDLYKKYHVIVVTDSSCRDKFSKPNSSESNGLKYLDKCPEPLIGVDIELFDQPNFPYSDDRPPCFYDVKVDGSLSSFEAFYDEKLRWKMILNRINYTGGFIDAKQILTAMNVTRTCKQPSWFSKKLACDIIRKYCTSNTIVDCFAGWGMRHDAAIELEKKYVGIDFNNELVKWHQQHNRDIQFGDANEFKFNDECSVFICPPYSDPETGRCFEDYNFDGFDSSAKALSQCDWLRIVMNNVPNAKEYVMVCKIIDPGFEKYVVETIENKSHFGINNEYILVISKAEYLTDAEING